MADYDLILRGAVVVGTDAPASPATADVAVSDGGIAGVFPDLAGTGVGQSFATARSPRARLVGY